MSRRRAVALLVTLLLLALGAAEASAGKSPRRRSNMPPGWTWPPSAVMKRSGQRCMRELDELGVDWKRGPKTRKVTTPVEVPGMVLGGVKLVSIFRKGPFVMDCQLAVSLARAGEVMHQVGVRELRFSTIHDYRQIRLRGKRRNALSRHALGLAVDVFAIVTDTGQTVVVEKDYRKKDPTLLALERGIAASLDFRTPLTPGNSRRSHRDHFHLEAWISFEDEIRTAMLTLPADARR